MHTICKRWIVGLVGGLLLVLVASAEDAQAQPADGLGLGAPPTDEWTGGLLVHTQGAGLSYQRGWYRDATHLRTVGTELLYIRHAKEECSQNPVYDDGRAYVYGKVNALIDLRLTVGGQRFHTEKLRKNAVRVGSAWRTGLALGILKPVYLEIGYPDIPYDYIALERYDPDVHFSDDIYGRGPWLSGVQELGFVPGLHGAYELEFEYGEDPALLRALNIGCALDVFAWSPEILADKFGQNHRTFLTLYAKLQTGRRWTR